MELSFYIYTYICTLEVKNRTTIVINLEKTEFKVLNREMVFVYLFSFFSLLFYGV